MPHSLSLSIALPLSLSLYLSFSLFPSLFIFLTPPAPLASLPPLLLQLVCMQRAFIWRAADLPRLTAARCSQNIAVVGRCCMCHKRWRASSRSSCLNSILSSFSSLLFITFFYFLWRHWLHAPPGFLCLICGFPSKQRVATSAGGKCNSGCHCVCCTNIPRNS